MNMYKNIYISEDIEREFLDHSNRIEREYSPEALADAIKAWGYLKDKTKITPQVIRQVHHILMNRLRPDIAGNWRRCTVMIGGRIKPFVSWQLIEEDVKAWCIHTNWTIESCLGDHRERSLQTKHSHISFEDIHPFEDGNGRVGRILYNWQRLQLGLKLNVIHEGEEQMKYYKWFRTRTKNEN